MSSKIKELKDVWEAQAQYDPLWAILSDPSKKGRKWDLKIFFGTGQREIASLMQRMSDLGLALRAERALDFGCGVGRLAQPLSLYFKKVIGVDISETMIELAKNFNRYGEACEFFVNAEDNLAQFESDSFDFIYASIVLQHIPPKIMFKYLLEFLRVLGANGILVFQLPSHQRQEYLLGQTPEPMSENAYRAQILVEPLPCFAFSPLAKIQAKVKVINMSSFYWRQNEMAPLRLGNHWLNAEGNRIITSDDGRVNLPDELKPGEEAEMILTVNVPDEEGEYLCELDLVHESITWFKDRGSATVTFTVVATGRAPILSYKRSVPPVNRIGHTNDFFEKRDIEKFLPRVTEEPKSFAMYGTKKEKIVEFLRRNGAEVVSVEEDGRCGWEWIGFCYYIRKE